MKKASLALLIGTTLVLSACGGSKETVENDKTYTTETEQYSYAIGARMGSFAQNQIARQDELGLPSDKDAIIAGFKDAFAGQAKFSEEEIEEFVQAFSIKFQEADNAEKQVAAAQLLEQSKTYLTENSQREGVVTTDSGLQYEVIVQGEGASPTADDTVRVHYHGTLIDGQVFDSSVERGEPAEFPLNRVIPGWTEGVQLMPVGSKYRFYIPSELAYGQRSTGMIPANSPLVFEVELLAIAPFTE